MIPINVNILKMNINIIVYSSLFMYNLFIKSLHKKHVLLKNLNNSDLKQLVDEFNKTGTGRFDLFVESLEMNGPWKLTEGDIFCNWAELGAKCQSSKSPLYRTAPGPTANCQPCPKERTEIKTNKLVNSILGTGIVH